jgi:murein L,D-transpeptidase YafK
LGKRIQEWASAWMSKDAEKYLSFYSTNFYSRKMNYEQWRKYKTRLSKNYKFIDVKINNLRLFRHNKYAVALFEQEYKSDRYQTRGLKRLYLVGPEDKAQILAEEALDLNGHD